MDELGAGILMLAGRGEGDREDLPVGPRFRHPHGRILHRQVAAEIAVDPFHRRGLAADGPLRDEVVDVVGPVLDRRVATAAVLLHDHLDDGRMEALGRVHRGGAALDVVHVGPLIDDDQRPLELPHALGIDAEIGLEREFDRHSLRDVDERTTRPDRRIERGELVVGRGDDLPEVLPQEVRVLADGGVGVGEDHPLLRQILLERTVDHLALELRLDPGEELPLRLGDPQAFERLLDLLRHVVPGLSLVIRRLEVIEDFLEVDADVSAPVRHRTAVEQLE